jgi:zinc and cadmium transporter
MTFLLILLAVFISSVGSILIALIFFLGSEKFIKNIIPNLIAFATGTLLASAFLGILPHAMEKLSPEKTSLTVLFGIIAFFILEKIIRIHHCHRTNCDSHKGHNHSSTMILIGDGLHNFLDGAIITTSFLISIPVGITTTLAIIAHEIPQEIGDFAILLHSGFSKKKAIFWNLVSSATAFLGAIIAFFALQETTNLIPYIMAIAASSFIYIALADLSPELHRRSTIKNDFQKIILLLLGVGLIFLTMNLHSH